MPTKRTYTPTKTPSTPTRTPSTPIKTPSTHIKTQSMPTKTPSTPTKTQSTQSQSKVNVLEIKMWILLPNIDLRCFVIRQFLSQIYPLFGRLFTGLNNTVVYQIWQIWGMTWLHFEAVVFVSDNCSSKANTSTATSWCLNDPWSNFTHRPGSGLRGGWKIRNKHRHSQNVTSHHSLSLLQTDLTSLASITR